MNRLSHVHTAQLDVHDFVLAPKKEPTKEVKLLLAWIGPLRVPLSLSEHTNEVSNILHESLSIVHANWLKLHADSQLNVSKELKHTMYHNHTTYHTVTK